MLNTDQSEQPDQLTIMAINNTLPSERRNGTRELISNLLKERRQLLVHFCQLAGLEPYTPNKPVATRLREFCQILIDYLAVVHFELYSRLLENGERRKTVSHAAQKHYPRIAASTERAVAFNDKYETINLYSILETLPDDLSELGELLATRFELEDILFSALTATTLHPFCEGQEEIAQ